MVHGIDQSEYDNHSERRNIERELERKRRTFNWRQSHTYFRHKIFTLQTVETNHNNGIPSNRFQTNGGRFQVERLSTDPWTIANLQKGKNFAMGVHDRDRWFVYNILAWMQWVPIRYDGYIWCSLWNKRNSVTRKLCKCTHRKCFFSFDHGFHSFWFRKQTNTPYNTNVATQNES